MPTYTTQSNILKNLEATSTRLFMFMERAVNGGSASGRRTGKEAKYHQGFVFNRIDPYQVLVWSGTL